MEMRYIYTLLAWNNKFITLGVITFTFHEILLRSVYYLSEFGVQIIEKDICLLHFRLHDPIKGFRHRHFWLETNIYYIRHYYIGVEFNGKCYNS